MKHRIPPQILDKWIRIGHGDPHSKLLCSRVPKYPKFAKKLLMLDLNMLLGSLNLSGSIASSCCLTAALKVFYTNCGADLGEATNATRFHPSPCLSCWCVKVIVAHYTKIVPKHVFQIYVYVYVRVNV